METKLYYFLSAFVVTTLIFISNGSGQQIISQIVDGPCSRFDVTDQIPFFKKLFMGTWYVYVTYDYPEIIGLDCLTVFYQLRPDGNATCFERGKNLMTNQRTTFTVLLEFDKPGVGQYNFADTIGDVPWLTQLPIVDYNQFYIEFSCLDQPGGKSDCYIGAFTRHRVPSIFVAARINEYFTRHNIDKSKLRYINHDKLRCIP